MATSPTHLHLCQPSCLPQHPTVLSCLFHLPVLGPLMLLHLSFLTCAGTCSQLGLRCQAGAAQVPVAVYCSSGLYFHMLLLYLFFLASWVAWTVCVMAFVHTSMLVIGPQVKCVCAALIQVSHNMCASLYMLCTSLECSQAWQTYAVCAFCWTWLGESLQSIRPQKLGNY